MTEGSPEPLGVSLSKDGVNVAVRSAHASHIEVCLFDAEGQAEISRIVLPGRTGPVFHGHIEGVGGAEGDGVVAPVVGQP